MINEFFDLWNKRKHICRKAIENRIDEGNFDMSYMILMRIILSTVFKDIVLLDELTEIDNGRYSGTKIFIFTIGHSGEPCIHEYVSTYVEYGSCSVCDELECIMSDMFHKEQKEEQINDLMSLCLHIIQRMKPMGSEEMFKEFLSYNM